MDEPTEELNPGPPTEPRPASSVILLRRGAAHGGRRLEVLLAKRSADARFMPSVWVFPGGAVDRAAAEAEPSDRAYRETALRELQEEVAVRLDDPDSLIPFSRWITPVEVAIRFDTRFYLAPAPPHCAPEADGAEIVDVIWLSPAEALERRSAGTLSLVFPTVKQLEALAAFRSADEAISAARARKVEPILPRVAIRNGEARVLLPGDPGYDLP